MKPIRILQVVTIMNRGGLETMLMNYYRKIDRTKIQFDFMTHRQERGHYDDEIEALGGKIYRMSPIRPGNYRKYFKELDEFFKEHKEYTIVHSHINENSGFVLRAAKKAGIHCRIAHSHLSNLKIDYKYPFRIYGRLNLKNNISDYFACSKKAGEWLFGKNIINSKKINILNNAVDLGKFEFNKEIRDKARAELGIKENKVIGHIGRFNPQKNHNFLIDVLNEIYKKDKDVVLLLIGDGYLKEKIKNKVRNLKLEDRVKFLGVREDIHILIQAMDLFIFPSNFEGLAVSMVEAQANGLKVITSTGVIKESDISGKVEFLSLKKGAKYWADRVLSQNFDIENRNNSSILENYDVNKSVEWLSKFYLEKNKVKLEV